MKLLRISACVLALSASLSAQIVLYETAFDDGAGWTGLNIALCTWDVDSVPGAPGGAYHSAPNSLNCNRPTGGYEGCFNLTATSPLIDLSAADGHPVNLTFWCNFSVEEVSCGYDTRHLRIADSAGNWLIDLCFLEADCGPNHGGWHEHVIPLDLSWGVIQLQFYFHIGDGLFCNSCFNGWFVDDLSVQTECSPPLVYCTPKLNSLGCSSTLFTTGTPSMSGAGQAFRIWAGNVLNQKVGLLIWGRAPTTTPFAGGTLCVAAPLTRTASQNSGGTAPPASDCTGTYVYQFTSTEMTQAGLVVGDRVYTQYWSRDNGFQPPDNVGLTAGLRFVICP